jgi:hypothetical protein
LVAGAQGYAMAFYTAAAWALVILAGYVIWTMRVEEQEIDAAK